MKLTIDSKITISYISKELLEYCNKELYFQNPKIQRMKAMGFWTRQFTKKYKTLY